MAAACQALRPLKPRRIIIAVPTGSLSAVRRVAELAEEVICLNIRSGPSFAVADADQEWCDLSEGDAIRMLREAWEQGKNRAGMRQGSLRRADRPRD